MTFIPHIKLKFRGVVDGHPRDFPDLPKPHLHTFTFYQKSPSVFVLGFEPDLFE